YNVLQSGVPNAIKEFKDLVSNGHKPLGIRLDSGDLKYLSVESKKMLDKEGLTNLSITASNDLDEYTIASLKAEGSAINSWGVGTKLITSAESPSLGGVYKLAGSYHGDVLEPKIKISEDPEKINNPGYKKVIRIYNSENKAEADLIMLSNETIDTSKPLTLFHPTYTWKSMRFENYTIRELHKPLFINGESKYIKKSVMEIRSYVQSELNTLWEAYRRLSSPKVYKVDLSQKLWDLKSNLLDSKKFI
ncbi:MAG: nicotinate phosphoribosyltransferase, partial [Peptostreptococcaceae bacterium]